jgi:hypothetical protein
MKVHEKSRLRDGRGDAGTMLGRCWDDAGTMPGQGWDKAGTRLGQSRGRGGIKFLRHFRHQNRERTERRCEYREPRCIGAIGRHFDCLGNILDPLSFYSAGIGNANTQGNESHGWTGRGFRYLGRRVEIVERKEE